MDGWAGFEVATFQDGSDRGFGKGEWDRMVKNIFIFHPSDAVGLAEVFLISLVLL